MNRSLLILGAGGHGRVVKETALAMGAFDKIDFLDDKFEFAIGKCEDYKHLSNNYTYAFCAFGNNELRKKWIENLNEVGFKLPLLVDPTAHVSPSASIGNGSIVCAKAVINTNVRIEKGCIISIGTLLDHDSHVGEYSHLNAGSILKAGCRVAPLMKVDIGVAYSNNYN